MLHQIGFLLLAPAALAAQTANLVSDPQFGFSFQVPPGARAEREPLWFAVGSATLPGMTLVMPLEETSMASLRKTASEGFLAGKDVQLLPSGPVQTLSPASLGIPMQGTIQGSAVRAYAIAMLGPGKGAYIMAGSPVAQFSEGHVAFVAAIAKTVRFGMTPAASGVPVSTDPAVAAWNQRLRNRQLHYFSRYNSSTGGNYSGYSEHKVIGLCADGRYSLNGQFDAAINVPGASATGANPQSTAGRWSLVSKGGQVYLLLGSETISLTTDGSKTYLNGTRWMVDDRYDCRGN